MDRQSGLWSWLLQRVSGAYLAFGMAVHIIVLPLGGDKISFDSISARLQHGGWLVFDLLLLATCLYHGFNGLWSVLLDFNPSIKIRQTVAWGLVVFGLIWAAYGVLVLVPFAR